MMGRLRLAVLCTFLVAVRSVAESPLAPALPSASVSPDVLLGIDSLEAQEFAPIKGKQIGLITNQTGRDSHGRSTADVLSRAPGVKLIALFAPEHGIRGQKEAGQAVGDAIDPKTHLPVYSLYGGAQKPTPEMLNSIDVLVFDMQDVGARFYTYLTTMAMAMEAAAQRHIGFLVLDRPNPLGGAIVEGQVLDPRIHHFTAFFTVPVRHGLTAGEMAKFYNATARIHANLSVVPVLHWKRSQIWDDTGLKFIPPSPNIRSPIEAILYAGIGMFEATNVGVGRGTDSPFERIGAPWIRGAELSRRLNLLGIPGVKFYQTIFEPEGDLYAGQLCSGVRMEVTNPSEVRPIDIFVQIACLLRELSPKDFQLRWDEVARVTGSHDFETQYKANKTAADILEVFHKSSDQFLKDRAPYLLY